jgi:hypothetical protein
MGLMLTNLTDVVLMAHPAGVAAGDHRCDPGAGA